MVVLPQTFFKAPFSPPRAMCLQSLVSISKNYCGLWRAAKIPGQAKKLDNVWGAIRPKVFILSKSTPLAIDHVTNCIQTGQRLHIYFVIFMHNEKRRLACCTHIFIQRLAELLVSYGSPASCNINHSQRGVTSPARATRDRSDRYLQPAV